jgi:hypothetical protein
VAEELHKVAPGDPLSISAAAWNQIVDAVRQLRADGPRPRGTAPLPALDRPVLVVRVKASGTLPHRGIVTLGGALIDPDASPFDAQSTPFFEADTPVSGGVPAVLLQPLSAGEVGRAVVLGVCVASVVINNAGHEYAVPVAGDVFTLDSATSGPFRLLTNPGVGTAKCLVMLGDTAPPTVTVEEADGAPSYAGVHTLRFDQADGFTVTQPAAGIARVDFTGGTSSYLAPVRCATVQIENVSDLVAGYTVDGETLASADRVLLTTNSTAANNGIYVVQPSGAPVRATDADTAGKLHGATVQVLYGDRHARTRWQCTAPNQPASFADQIWERLGNTTYQVEAGEFMVGWAAPGSGFDTPIPCRIGPPSPPGQLGAALDDGPGFAGNTNFGGGAPPQYRSLQFGLSSSAGTVAAGYPWDVPIAFSTVTRDDTGLPTGTTIAVGLAAGNNIGSAVQGGGAIGNPLVLRAYGGPNFNRIALGGYLHNGTTWVSSFLTILPGGGIDSSGGFSVGGVPGYTGTLPDGSESVGGLITAPGSSSLAEAQNTIVALSVFGP